MKILVNPTLLSRLPPIVHPKIFLVIGINILSLSIIILNSTSIQKIKQRQHVVKAINQEMPVFEKERQGLPKRLKIPKIHIDAIIENVGVSPDGTMEVPQNTFDVGWYQFGARPGENGSAVISGHFDGRSGESGVFNKLDKLKQGDEMDVINDHGIITTFAVRESRTYTPGFVDEVFLSNDDGIHLNLITCDGFWDEVKKSYTKRLVVFADKIN